MKEGLRRLSMQAAPAMFQLPGPVRGCSMSTLTHQLASLLGRHSVDSGGFAEELVSERAAALGRAGRKVELALEDLRQGQDGPDREALLKTAAAAVWAFFVQREACGFRDQKGVIAHYDIPRAVLVRMGAR